MSHNGFIQWVRQVHMSTLTILQKYFSLQWCRAQSKGGVKNSRSQSVLILLTLMPKMVAKIT